MSCQQSGKGQLVQQRKHSNVMNLNTAHVIQRFVFVPEVNVIETLQNRLQLISRVEGFQSVGAYHVLNLLLQSHL
jgi:heme-degrading monooxygenase HmoA